MPARWTTADIPDQTGRTVLITGANAGIGYHTALQLAAKGATVVLASRDPERGRAAHERILATAPQARVEVVTLDLADLDSVGRLADQVLASDDGLEVLVNNAGVMGVPDRRTTAQGFELQFGTNHLGHFALTGRLLPALLARPASRVVTVSSAMHRLGRLDLENPNSERGYRRWQAYNASKLANALFSLELDRRLRAAGAATASVGAHPGYCRTGLQTTGPRLGDAGPVGVVSAGAVEWFTRLTAQPAAQGALAVLRAATDPEVAGGDYLGPDGFGGGQGWPVKAEYSKIAQDKQIARRLWTVSERLTGRQLPRPGGPPLGALSPRHAGGPRWRRRPSRRPRSHQHQGSGGLAKQVGGGRLLGGQGVAAWPDVVRGWPGPSRRAWRSHDGRSRALPGWDLLLDRPRHH